MVAAENLGKRFDHGWLFRNLTFELPKGSHLTIRGRNGSGKSTLIRLIAGLGSPTEGVITRPNTQLGFFALDGALYGSLTVREQLEFGAAMQQVEIDAMEWLRRLDLVAAEHRPCAKLSTGMRSRVKLAMAVFTRPSLLLLDEPSAGLDGAGRELLLEIAKDQLERGWLISATNEADDWSPPTHVLEL